MVKKRVFIANDASFLDTGYGIYGREIISRLHQSDKFEVAELGCYADISNPKNKTLPWKFYPNAVASSDPRADQYKANNLNQFGLWRFNRAVADFKPHIVFDIRDYWMFAYQETSPYKKYFHWVIMPATDSAPQKTEWLYTFANADIVVPYTDWAKKVLSESCGNNINLFPSIANAGINPQEFYPIENKQQHKISYFGEDLSVVGLVMRNQKRKLLPDIMIAYKKYLEALKSSGLDDLYNKSCLYLHTSYPEENGWDIPGLLLEFNLLNKVYFTYICRHCNNFFPSKFQTAITNCKYCHNKTASIASPHYGVNTEQLNKIYNVFDLFMQYAICEGFGMPQVEAAACGLQIASVDYSAMSEIAQNLNGFKIPVHRMFREMETNADRAYPDIEATTKIMYDFFVNTSDETKLVNSSIIRQKCIDQYTWDAVYQVWENCFDSVDISKKLSWNTIISETDHESVAVPKNLEIQEFVEFICNNILKEPTILQTSNVQCLIRDCVSGLVARNGNLSSINKNQIIEILEQHLNNKIMCEKMKNDPAALKKEDFIS
jgi:glycosyltransferase involved in cell wall biosynthesis